MSVNEIRSVVFENYYKRFSKENIYYSIKRLKRKDLLLVAKKLIEKILDPQNAKENYQSFLRRKNRKSVKQSEIITYKPKTFENPNIADIKSVITEHPKTLHKLYKTIRQAEKVGSNSSLDGDTKKSKRCKNNETSF